MIKIFCLFLLFNLTTPVFAQALFDVEEYRTKYPGQHAVFLIDQEKVTIDFDKDTIQTTVEVLEDLLHLNDRSHIYSTTKIPYSYFSNITSIDAKTLVPHKSKYKTSKVEHFTDKQEFSSGIFFDDYRSKNFIYPSVQTGSRTVLHYKREIYEPKLMFPFFFGATIPMEEAQLIVTVNKDIKLNYRLFNTDEVEVQYRTEEKGKYITHIWKANKLPGFKYESDAPDPKYYLPHVIYYVEKYHGKKEQNVLETVDDLYNWYYSFVEDILQHNDTTPELKGIVDSLTKDLTTDRDKVKAIYYWVQDNISYIAVEDGYRGFIPRKAKTICYQRYGDCKDMSSLIYSMLKIANIEGHLTWIGTRKIPYQYSGLPTPMVDNHMIATYIENDSFYFLDATSKYTRFDLPSSMIQGKEALIGFGPGEYQIKKVPVMPKETNLFIDSTEMIINGNRLELTGKVYLNGYNKIIKTYALLGKTKSVQEDVVKSLIVKGSNKFFLDSFSLVNLQDREKPLIISYDCAIEDYLKQIDSEVYLNLNLDKSFMNEIIDLKKRQVPKENDYLLSLIFYTRLKIPPGYELQYLPKNDSYEHPLFGYDIRYEKNDDAVIQHKSLTLNHLILEKTNFEDWNEMIKKINNAYKEVLILKAHFQNTDQ